MPGLPGFVSQTGRIDRLEVLNFKSYKGKQIIGPFHNFTAIIGPNGAGKSNLMDAISFVLGVRSAQLRGDKLRDLVYSTGENDPEKDSRRAYVMLAYRRDGSSEELKLTRGITVAGASEYRINGTVVSWDDYNEKLKSMGILVKARNFLVFQGDVESIASKNPKELTGLLEQISGSDELRKDYEKLEEEKRRAEENTALSYQKKRNMTAEKKQRKEQKEEAERHLQLQEELKQKKTDLYLWQLFMNEHDAKEAQMDLEAANEELGLVETDLRALDARSEEKRKQSAGHAKEASAAEKKAAKKEAEIEKERPKLLKLQEAHKRQQTKYKESKQALKDRKKEHEEHLTEIARLERNLRDVKAELKKVEDSEDSEDDGVQLAQTQLDEYHKLKNTFGSKTIKLKQDKETLERQQAADRNALSHLEQNQKQMEEREAQLEQAGNEAKANAAKVDKDMAAAKELVKKMQQDEIEIIDKNRRAKNRVEVLQNKLQATERKLREANADRRESEQEIRSSEAVATMKRLFPGVHGRISDLCKTTHRKYQLAVTVVLGKFFDAVAVEDEATAKDCIQYLRDQRLPPMLFIPLASARVKPVQERLRTLGGTSALIIDILMFPEAIKTAVLYAIGNTLVCDTLDEARKLAWDSQERNKVVTLDGTLLSKNGQLTGGNSGSIEDKARRLQNADQNIDALKEERDKYLAELERIGSVRDAQQREQEIRSKIMGQNRKIHFGEVELKAARERAHRAKAELDALRAQRNKMAPELDKLNKTIEKRAAEVQVLETRINEIADITFADFCRSVGVSNIREYEDEPLRRAEQLAKQLLQLRDQATKLENQLQYEKHRDTEGPIKDLEKTVKSLEAELKRLIADSDEVQATLQRMRDEQKEIQEQVKELKENAEKVEGEAQAIAKQRTTLTAKLGKAKRHVTVKETLLVQLAATRKELLETCELEQIPLRRENGDAVSMEIDSGTGAPSSAAAAESLDYSGLPRKFRQATVDKTEGARDKLMEEVKLALEELAAELERTAPNLKAMEQYDLIKEKERHASEEFEKVRAESKNITERFLQVKKERMERFMRAFEHISSTIDRIYKDLTRSRTHPLGGSAYLSLESEDDPFNNGIKFTAMPPTKRFRDMDQLSGGEKTVAALALLFSIHRYETVAALALLFSIDSFRPSPFFVLDEVDAALDNLNVAKVAAYIRDKSRDEAIHGTGQGTVAGNQVVPSGGTQGPEPHVAGFQSVVISLKDQFFDKADALVGVCRDNREGCSKVLTLDLSGRPVA